MNRIAGIPHYRPIPSQRQQRPSLSLPGPKPDHVLFGHKTHEKHEGHIHTHGAEKKHIHPAHDTHSTCTEDGCTKPHAKESHSQEKTQGNWLKRQIQAIKSWFTNAYEYIRDDLARLGHWLGIKKDDPSKANRK